MIAIVARAPRARLTAPDLDGRPPDPPARLTAGAER
jgi:hypothetical protein